jgi:putative hydrolase of the HAD superfamily
MKIISCITNGFAEVQGRKKKMLSCMIIFILSQTLIWLGLKKPPYYFEYALDLVNNKENSIMIGDSLDADVQGALDMGLDAIFLIRIKFKWNKK